MGAVLGRIQVFEQHPPSTGALSPSPWSVPPLQGILFPAMLPIQNSNMEFSTSSRQA